MRRFGRIVQVVCDPFPEVVEIEMGLKCTVPGQERGKIVHGSPGEIVARPEIVAAHNATAPVRRHDLGMIPRRFQPVDAGEHPAGMDGEEAGPRIKIPGEATEQLDQPLVRFTGVGIVPEKNPHGCVLAAGGHPLQSSGDGIQEMPRGIGFQRGDIHQTGSRGHCFLDAFQ